MELHPTPFATAKAPASHPVAAHAPTHHVPTRYRKRTGLSVAIFAILVAAGLTAIFVFRHLSRGHEQAALDNEVERSADAPVPVDIVHVKPGSHDTELVLPGEAHAYYEATIKAQTTGYVVEGDDELADIGDHVKKDQILATIATPEVDDQLVAAKAKVDQLKAEVHVAETAVTFAKLSAERWEAATPGGAVSKQERDQKQSELEASKAKLESAKAQVALGEAEVGRLNTLEKFKYVTAPFSGTITVRHVDIGVLVKGTDTTPMFTIEQSDKIRVYVKVPQVAAGDIKIGMPVTLMVRNGKEETFPGTVDRTAEAVDPESRTLRVEVLVINKTGALRSGSALQATFHTKREHPPLEVPAAALDFKPSGPQVAVVSADGRITFRDVKIDNDMGDKLEVSGLNEGERVALNVGNGISEGEKVEVHDLDAPAAEKGGDAAHVAVR